MSSGLIAVRDFVYGLEGQGKDWHGQTVEKVGPLTRDMFPEMEEQEIVTKGGIALPWKILVTKDDNQPCGRPFKDSFGYLLPSVVWGKIEEALEGTDYTVERIGMLWDRSFWFVGVQLDALKEVSRDGELYRLNFSGGLDGDASPQGELSHIRPVCWNTISASRRAGEYLFKIRQTSHSKDRLENAKNEVEKAVGLATIFNKTLAKLGEQECSVDFARYAYAGEVARAGGDFAMGKTKKGEVRENRSRNTVDELVELFKFGDGNSGETRLDLLNGFTQMHTRGRKESKKNVWTQIASSEFGTGADRKVSFLDAIVDEADFTMLVDEGKEALATK